MIIDFSNWREYEGFSEGSGRSEKTWLVNPENGEVGLFKYTKTEYTTEHISEKLAKDISKKVDIDCMKVDLGKYNSRIGSLSYKINQNGESLIEGIQLITKYYNHYDENTLYDKKEGEYYSFYMIIKALQEYDFKKDFFKMLILDFLIGNTDRHHSNWAILQKGKKYRFCPLYDNSSSLCCYIRDENIDNYLGNDKLRFMALVDSKSTSRIRIDRHLKKEPSHLKVMEFLYKNHYSAVIGTVKKAVNALDEKAIIELVEQFNQILSKKRRRLIMRFLLEKLKLLRNQFDL